MARRKRIDLPGLAHHLWIRGNDRRDIFFSDADRYRFLECMGEAARKRQCEVHAFVLMTNHVHVLATPRAPRGMSKMIQDMGRKYVRHVNTTYARTGGLYEGRFKSTLVETRSYFLKCMRYIELNPVRAHMVAHPVQFPWSSFGQNVTGEPTGLVTPHPEYLTLAPDAQSRGAAYGRMLEADVDGDELKVIREALQQGCALGSPDFCRAVESMLGRPALFVPQGRPQRPT